MNSAKSGSRSNGHAEVEARPLAYGALNPQAPAVCFHDMTGNREAQPGAASLTGTRGVYPVEAFENSFLLHLRDSDAGIGNRDDHPASESDRKSTRLNSSHT